MKTVVLVVVLLMFCLLAACRPEPESLLYEFRVQNDTSEMLYVWVDPPSLWGVLRTDLSFRTAKMPPIDTPALPDGIVHPGTTMLIDRVSPGKHWLYAEAPYNKNFTDISWSTHHYFTSDYTQRWICEDPFCD